MSPAANPSWSAGTLLCCDGGLCLLACLHGLLARLLPRLLRHKPVLTRAVSLLAGVEPLKGLDETQSQYVLGGQACQWSEGINQVTRPFRQLEFLN